MKISVIIAVYNGAKTIRDTIDSILMQQNVDVECIVIDGGSKDQTVEIAKSYGNKIATIVSESDKGMYDAMNKGIKLATGEIIAILNADDMYEDARVLEKVAAAFQGQPTKNQNGTQQQNKTIGCVYGNIRYVDQHDTHKIKRTWISREYAPGLFKKGWHPPHPAFFVRKNIYETFGTYRTDLSISADYEMMLRLLEINHVPSVYIPEFLVRMRDGGMSNKSFKNIFKANMQVLRAWKINGRPVPYQIFLLKPFSKLRQIKIATNDIVG
jgi:glycosyltransferase